MRSSVAAIAVIVAMAGSAEATQENIYAVAQPVDSDGTGPTISDVTFVTWSDTLHEPSLLICLTAAESRVRSPYGFENRNMANRAGIRITAVRAAGSVGGYPGFFGDTLRVVLDVSAATAALSADGSPVLNLTGTRCFETPRGLGATRSAISRSRLLGTAWQRSAGGRTESRRCRLTGGCSRRDASVTLAAYAPRAPEAPRG